MDSSPRDGGRKPAIRCSRVDLPAPFGPSRPVTPGPMVIVMSLTATTLPYQRDTLRSSMVVMLCSPLASGALLGAAFPRRSSLAPQSRRRRAPPARSCGTGLPVPGSQAAEAGREEDEQHHPVEPTVLDHPGNTASRGSAEPLPHPVQGGEWADPSGQVGPRGRYL